MENKEYLNEEKYQKTEKLITLVAILILVVGLCIGGFLIYNGVAKPSTSTVEELKVELENKKSELESKGVVYDKFARYSDGDAYDLKIITNALDPSFSHCEFDEYKNNSLTKDYCAAKNKTSEYSSVPFIVFGVFICIASCMIAGPTFMFAKRRSIFAFSTQQVMPVAQEGMKKMAPTIGEVGKEIMTDMAPAYGEMAKEISKGIKEGLKDDKKDDDVEN